MQRASAAAPRAPADPLAADGRRAITRIIIHCSATPNGRWNTARDIDDWHRQRGFQRSDSWVQRFNPWLFHIGYHYVIYVNGGTATGRHLDEVGAHAAGYNADSVGICMLGTDRFTAEQWHALEDLVERLLAKRCPGAQVLGHRDLPGVTKACPGFDVATWRALHGGFLPQHTLIPEADNDGK